MVAAEDKKRSWVESDESLAIRKMMSRGGGVPYKLHFLSLRPRCRHSGGPY